MGDDVEVAGGGIEPEAGLEALEGGACFVADDFFAGGEDGAEDPFFAAVEEGVEAVVGEIEVPEGACGTGGAELRDGGEDDVRSARVDGVAEGEADGA